ncbi:hypothetical protein FOZ62_013127, partial [Perkinsus olseni]
MIASVLFLVIGLYAVCFSEMMPYTGTIPVWCQLLCRYTLSSCCGSGLVLNIFDMPESPIVYKIEQDDVLVREPLIGRVGQNTALSDEKAEPRGKSDGLRSALKVAKERAAAMPGRLVFLLLLGLSPIGIMLVFSLTRLHSLLLAMFIMHALCMVLIPAIFIVLDQGDSSAGYRTYFSE